LDQILQGLLVFCRIVRMGGCTPSGVDRLIFVGGSSLMGVVESSLAPEFPNAQLDYSDAFTAIVDGLAIAAERVGP
jgi:hypothetical chaperone protein